MFNAAGFVLATSGRRLARQQAEELLPEFWSSFASGFRSGVRAVFLELLFPNTDSTWVGFSGCRCALLYELRCFQCEALPLHIKICFLAELDQEHHRKHAQTLPRHWSADAAVSAAGT